MEEFRVYTLENTAVAKTYFDMVTNQTLDYVLSHKKKYESFPNFQKKLWDVLLYMDEIVDESDPDNDLPQWVHAYQTALSIENRYFDRDLQFNQNYQIRDLFNDEEWGGLPDTVKELYNQHKTVASMFPHIGDWDFLILIGFIHDLGKVLLCTEWGQLPQWSVVGDTFPVGCKYQESNVYSEQNWYSQNPDSQDNKLSSEFGIYGQNCGFDQLHFTFSHDEYLARILERNNNNFPKEAVYQIRYHSFYPWHTPRKSERGYQQFASEYDWKMLPLLKVLQKADLYSKSREIPEIETAKAKFDYLIKKYINVEVLQW